MDATSSSTGTAASDLAVMMEELGLTEADLQDVIVEEEELLREATRWMALARVHTDKPYNQYWFFRNMRVAWDLAQEVKIRPLEDNLYTMQFSCLGDRERVMKEGPWNNKGKAVVLAPYDGFTKPSTIELDKIDIWADWSIDLQALRIITLGDETNNCFICTWWHHSRIEKIFHSFYHIFFD